MTLNDLDHHGVKCTPNIIFILPFPNFSQFYSIYDWPFARCLHFLFILPLTKIFFYILSLNLRTQSLSFVRNVRYIWKKLVKKNHTCNCKRNSVLKFLFPYSSLNYMYMGREISNAPWGAGESDVYFLRCRLNFILPYVPMLIKKKW